MEQQLKDLLAQILEAAQQTQADVKALAELLASEPAPKEPDLSEVIQNAQSTLDVLNAVHAEAQAVLTAPEKTE